MHWHGDEEPSTDVLSFRWGRKFNRYVAACADLMKHLAFAARDEGNQGGARLTIVSGSVTHANVDYLIRLYRADPDVFRYVDKVGIHPYHWPEHDIWRTDFVSRIARMTGGTRTRGLRRSTSSGSTFSRRSTG